MLGKFIMVFIFLYDCVLVCCFESEEKIVGGLIILDSVKEKFFEGEVVVVGVGVCKDSGELIVLVVVVGDKVLFGKWFGIEVIVDGEELLMMKEFDIMGILF